MKQESFPKVRIFRKEPSTDTDPPEPTMNSNKFELPTKDSPMLLGILVDVSGSMTSSIQNRLGENINRLQSFERALGEFARCAGQLGEEHGKGLIYLFAYGFGFGGLLSFFAGKSGPEVRDLLEQSGEHSSTISLDYLAKNWDGYQAQIHSLVPQMFGNTPMGQCFRVASQRFENEFGRRGYTNSPVLFVLSDGEPTDSSYEDILACADQLKNRGILIFSCYVTNSDITEPRHIYGAASNSWPKGARLMFDCASPLPPNTPFEEYMREHKWTVEECGRLFTQINQSEVLSEFLNMLLSPLQNQQHESVSAAINTVGQAKRDYPYDAGLPAPASTDIVRPRSSLDSVKVQSQRTRLLHLITNWTFVTGIVVSLLGVLLIIVGGARADSSVSLFGQRITTTNVGVSTVFIGVVMIVSNIRRVLKSFDKD